MERWRESRILPVEIQVFIMKPILLLNKAVHRARFVAKLLFQSLRMWGIKTWLKFWFFGADELIDVKGAKYSIRKSSLAEKITDLAIFSEIFLNDSYKVCRIRSKDIVVDIGAHIGAFSIYASKKSKKVLSYEPFPSTFDSLKKNLSLNGCRNVKIKNMAVGAKEGYSWIYMNKLNSAENSMYRKSRIKHKVKVTTLAQVLNGIKRCDVLKIDCEGAEYEIILSSKDALKKVNRIILEFHEPEFFGLDKRYSVELLVKTLESYGFKTKIIERNYYQGIIYALRIKP